MARRAMPYGLLVRGGSQVDDRHSVPLVDDAPGGRELLDGILRVELEHRFPLQVALSLCDERGPVRAAVKLARQVEVDPHEVFDAVFSKVCAQGLGALVSRPPGL